MSVLAILAHLRPDIQVCYLPINYFLTIVHMKKGFPKLKNSSHDKIDIGAIGLSLFLDFWSLDRDIRET